jgi:hypothetical protein
VGAIAAPIHLMSNQETYNQPSKSRVHAKPGDPIGQSEIPKIEEIQNAPKG